VKEMRGHTFFSAVSNSSSIGNLGEGNESKRVPSSGAQQLIRFTTLGYECS
jgi:hypothetical protein